MISPIQLKRFDGGENSFDMGELRSEDLRFPLTELDYRTVAVSYTHLTLPTIYSV